MQSPFELEPDYFTRVFAKREDGTDKIVGPTLEDTKTLVEALYKTFNEDEYHERFKNGLADEKIAEAKASGLYERNHHKDGAPIKAHVHAVLHNLEKVMGRSLDEIDLETKQAALLHDAVEDKGFIMGSATLHKLGYSARTIGMVEMATKPPGAKDKVTEGRPADVTYFEKIDKTHEPRKAFLYKLLAVTTSDKAEPNPYTEDWTDRVTAIPSNKAAKIDELDDEERLAKLAKAMLKELKIGRYGDWVTRTVEYGLETKRMAEAENAPEKDLSNFIYIKLADTTHNTSAKRMGDHLPAESKRDLKRKYEQPLALLTTVAEQLNQGIEVDDILNTLRAEREQATPKTR